MRFTIKLKLGLAFGLITVMLLAASYLGVSSLASSNDTMNVITGTYVQRLNIAKEVKIDVLDFVRRCQDADL
jgi:methyl-accepting chemotaxis protein